MLANRTAVITGSTSGIGLGMARAFARAGCRVVLNGFAEPPAIDALRDELSRLCGREALHHPADMTRPADIRALMDFAATNCGGVDILCNNAGIQHTAPVDAFPAEKWDEIIAINLSAAFHATRAALPMMRAAGWGRIINTASVHGLVASANKAAYVAAKHGLVGLTRVVALETAGSGVTRNAICPGWVRTELVERQIVARAEQRGVDREDAARGLLAEKQPSQQFVQVEHVASLALYLCSDAAVQITGAALTLDGGWTAQ